MRRMLAALLLVAVAQPVVAAGQPTAAAIPIDPARLVLARDIVAVVLPPAQREQMMSAVLGAMMQTEIAGIVTGTPGLQAELSAKPQVRSVFERFVARQQSLGEADINKALPDLVEAYARAYARTFTADELTQVKAFVATPAGARFMQRGSTILSDPDVAAWQRRVTAEAAARQKTEVAAFARDLGNARMGKDQ